MGMETDQAELGDEFIMRYIIFNSDLRGENIVTGMDEI